MKIWPRWYFGKPHWHPHKNTGDHTLTLHAVQPQKHCLCVEARPNRSKGPDSWDLVFSFKVKCSTFLHPSASAVFPKRVPFFPFLTPLWKLPSYIQTFLYENPLAFYFSAGGPKPILVPFLKKSTLKNVAWLKCGLTGHGKADAVPWLWDVEEGGAFKWGERNTAQVRLGLLVSGAQLCLEPSIVDIPWCFCTGPHQTPFLCTD